MQKKISKNYWSSDFPTAWHVTDRLLHRWWGENGKFSFNNLSISVYWWQYPAYFEFWKLFVQPESLWYMKITNLLCWCGYPGGILNLYFDMRVLPEGSKIGVQKLDCLPNLGVKELVFVQYEALRTDIRLKI